MENKLSSSWNGHSGMDRIGTTRYDLYNEVNEIKETCDHCKESDNIQGWYVYQPKPSFGGLVLEVRKHKWYFCSEKCLDRQIPPVQWSSTIVGQDQ